MRVILSILAALVATAAFGDAPAAHRWVLVRAGSTLSPLASGAATDNAVGAQSTGLVALQFIADHGLWLEVATPGYEPDPLFCVSTSSGELGRRPHNFTHYALKGSVLRSAAVEVTREVAEADFADGTHASVEPGVPVERFEGLYSVSLAKSAELPSQIRGFSLPLPAGKVGLDFALPTFRSPSRGRSTWELENSVQASLGPTALPLFVSDQHLRAEDVLARGADAFVTLHDRCDTLTVRVPAKKLAKVEGNWMRDESLGTGCTALHSYTVEWKVRSGAQVFWESGALAGTTTGEDTFATPPTRRGALSCFGEGLETPLKTPGLCFAEGDVTHLRRGESSAALVPPCPLSRPRPTARTTAIVRRWLPPKSPTDTLVTGSADCDLGPGGELACCDLDRADEPGTPPEKLVRRALFEVGGLQGDAGQRMTVRWTMPPEAPKPAESVPSR